LGGVTEQVLRRSDVPVLVVSGGDDEEKMKPGYSRVLITTDGSENADVAIPHGIGIAQRYGSTVHVLNVVDIQAAGGPFNAGGLEKEFVERLEARGKDAVGSVARKIKESAPSLTVETAVKQTTSFEGQLPVFESILRKTRSISSLWVLTADRIPSVNCSGECRFNRASDCRCPRSRGKAI